MIDEQTGETEFKPIGNSELKPRDTYFDFFRSPEAPPDPKPKKKKKKMKKGARITLIVVAVVVVAAVGLFFALRSGKKPTTSNFLQAKVMMGNIQKTITGSGSVQPIHQYNVVPTVTGDIVADYITQGQTINKGDKLYDIDPTNAENAVKQNENALERAQVAYDQSVQAVGNLNINSDVSGIITKLYIKEGDQVMQNGQVAEVVDTTNLTLSLPFNSDDAAAMSLGESALVTLESTGTTLSGTVARIYTGKQIGTGGSLVSNVDIALQNPGVVKSGDVATAVVGGQYACNASGTIAFASDKIITAKTSGQVSKLNLRAGDAVPAGGLIAVMTNDATVAAEQTSSLTLQNAQFALQNAKDALANYTLTSPISGSVIQKTSKSGDTIASLVNSTTMAIVADMSSLVLDISVDELDILNVKEGMTAAITADALPGKMFTGTITNVSTVGKATSGQSMFSFGGFSGTGVTNYTVEITITDYGALLPGMNVNATIVTASANNVMLVPQQAVQFGSFVLRKVGDTPAKASTAAPAAPSHSAAPSGAGAGAAGSFGFGAMGTKPTAPKGYEYVKVTVGLTNTMFAEIKDGLNVGDTVGYTIASAPSFGFGMYGGGFGGGAPGR